MIEISLKKKVFKKKELFSNLNIKIRKTNKIITIWGESGSGKSTLCNMIKGTDLKYEGEIKINNKKVTKIQNDVSVVYQDNKLLENITIMENLTLFSNDLDKINKYLEKFKLINLKDEKVKNISGGEKQRVAIIRSLLQSIKYLILDEPTAGLDDDNFFNLVKILKEIAKDIQIIISTHDLRFKELKTVEYHIKDKSIVNIENNEEENKEELKGENRGQEKNKKSLFKNTLLTIKNTKMMYSYKIIIFVVLLMIYSFSISMIFSQGEDNMNAFYQGMSDELIFINSHDLKKERTMEYNGKTYTFNTEPNKMNFNMEDIKNVEQIKGVKNVYLGQY